MRRIIRLPVLPPSISATGARHIACTLRREERVMNAINYVIRILLIVLLVVSTAACELIGDIFQAGVWVGVILVVLVLALVGFAVSKMRR
jgi:hypothetical protein